MKYLGGGKEGDEYVYTYIPNTYITGISEEETKGTE